MNEDYEQILESLPLASHTFTIPIIVIVYLFSVLKLGSLFMKNKKPFLKLRPIIIIYNFFQIVSNFLLIFYTLIDINFIKALLYNLTGYYQQPFEVKRKFIIVGYLWFILKVSDLLDTLFFIAMKKFSHVTFLHVYHHTTTMIVAYIVFKYIHIEQGAIYAAVNSCVHVTMYTYYFLTSLGRRPKWKYIITVIQLSQFIFLYIFTFILIFFQKNPIYYWFSIYSLAQCVMYIYLFSKFYSKSY